MDGKSMWWEDSNMTPREQIDKAIGAHGMWKALLKSAIDTGEREFDPNVVGTDSSCDFGNWLHGTVAPELRQSPIYKTVLEYHSEFHRIAGRILALALAGKKDEATKAVSVSSKFATISAVLTTTMIEWKRSLL